MTPKFGRGALAAYRHPWRTSLASGLVMYTWAKFAVRVTTPQAVLGGLVVITFVLILWIPRFGLARPYAEKFLADQQRAADRNDP